LNRTQTADYLGFEPGQCSLKDARHYFKEHVCSPR
jgi:hypothetical protein